MPGRKVRRHLSRTDSLHYLQNSTGRSPICFGAFSVMYRPNGSSYPQKQHRTLANFCLALFRSCTDRMAQVTLKNSTGRSPIFILALFRSCTDRAAHFTPKNSTGRSPFCFLRFLRSLRVRGGVCLLLALSWPKGPVKFFAYVAPKGVMLFDSNVRFK